MNQKKAGILLSYVSEIVKILSALFYTPVMIRLLGTSEYGLYGLVSSVVSNLALLNLGFTAAYVRYYSQTKVNGTKDEMGQLNGMFMTMFILIAIIAAVCGIIMIQNMHAIFKTGLKENEYATARVLMILMVFNLSISFPNSVFDCIISAHEQFFFQRLLTVLQSILNPFLTLPLLLLGFGSIGMIIIATGLTIAKVIINIWFVLKKLKVRFIFKHFNFSLLKDIWKFTIFLFINQIIDQINWNVDRFLLGRMIGTTAVAVYGLGGQINTMYLQLSTSVSSVFVPQINRIIAERNDNHELSLLFIKIGRMQFIILALVLSGFVFVGHPFMIMWGGADFSDSYYVALWLITPVTVPLIQNIGIEIQRAKNMHRARAIVYLLIAIGNILLSIPLIMKFGSIGAAIGTAVSLFAGNILFINWYYSRKMGLEIGLFWKNILSLSKGLIFPIVIGILILRFISINNIITLIAVVLFYTCVYAVSMWLMGMNDQEKAMIMSEVQKIKHKFVKKR